MSFRFLTCRVSKNLRHLLRARPGHSRDRCGGDGLALKQAISYSVPPRLAQEFHYLRTQGHGKTVAASTAFSELAMRACHNVEMFQSVLVSAGGRDIRAEQVCDAEYNS